MVSRPSPAAWRSVSATRSRSASEARRCCGSGTAGELLISVKPRRTRAHRYSGAPGCYRNLMSRAAPCRELSLGLGQHHHDVAAEADIARVVRLARVRAGDEFRRGDAQRLLRIVRGGGAERAAPAAPP